MTWRKVRLTDRRRRTVIYRTLTSMMIVTFYGTQERNRGKSVTASIDDATATMNKQFRERNRERRVEIRRRVFVAFAYIRMREPNPCEFMENYTKSSSTFHSCVTSLNPQIKVSLLTKRERGDIYIALSIHWIESVEKLCSRLNRLLDFTARQIKVILSTRHSLFNRWCWRINGVHDRPVSIV